MNGMDQNPDEMLDAIIGDVRADEPDARVIEEAGRRVWARMAAEAAAPHSEVITNCAGFQSLVPEYKANTLTPARRMLMQDHLHECVACRRALHADEAAATPKVVTMKPRGAWMPAKWAIAAALLIGTGIGSWYSWKSSVRLLRGAGLRCLQQAARSTGCRVICWFPPRWARNWTIATYFGPREADTPACG